LRQVDRHGIQEVREGGVGVDPHLVVSWLALKLFVLQLKVYWPVVASYRNWAPVLPVAVATISTSP
jgi:hypothetical protein